MKKSIAIQLYKGMEVNKNLGMKMNVYYEDSVEQFPTIIEKNNTYYIRPSFLLVISEGYQRPMVTIGATSWFQFVALYNKSIKLIQDNLYNLFPNVEKMSWDDIDTKELERFQTEKCMYINGYSIVPIAYPTDFQEYVPGILITAKDNKTVRIPFEDAIIIGDILDKMNPIQLSIECIQMILNKQKE